MSDELKVMESRWDGYLQGGMSGMILVLISGNIVNISLE
jgi:hypothetical protein